MKKFIVFYVKDCSQHLGFFKSASAAKRFVLQFLSKNRTEDDWVDMIIDGKVIQEEDGYRGYIQKPKLKRSGSGRE